jgi:Flp pilus assembly protein TadD
VDDAKRAFGAGDCQSARADARTALSAVGTHPAAHEILGWCNLDDGREAAAVRDMREAARFDPKHWRYRYALAVARGAAGRDPRPDVRLARRLDPMGEIFSSGAALQLARADRAWVRLARAAARPGN